MMEYIRRITDNDYDRFYQSFHEQIADIDTRLARLQEAEDNYYVTAKYLLELASKAHELFVSSEIEERRQLIKLVVQNLKLEGKKVQFQAQKPFDTILNYNDNQLWLLKRNITINSYLAHVFKVFEDFKLIAEIRKELDTLKDPFCLLYPSYNPIP